MTTRTRICRLRIGPKLLKKMESESPIPPTTCSKGHTHPPWNTSGTLRIAKCETVCGFCRKETDTAAKLRKHAAVHIRNERLDLYIAEAASGRGRLEVYKSSTSHDHVPSSSSPSSSRIASIEDDDQQSYSSTSPYTTIAQRPAYSLQSANPSLHQTSLSLRPSSPPFSSPSTSHSSYPASHPTLYHPSSYAMLLPPQPTDPFSFLRSHSLHTKFEWTVITPAEGFAILDLCKTLSQAQTSSSSSSGALHIPCYNRETLFDEEWQGHMRDVHGVYLIWPETWMKRVEVLDLDSEGLGGRIERVNDLVMMEGRDDDDDDCKALVF